MKTLIAVISLFVVAIAFAQDKPIPLSEQKVKARIGVLEKEYIELQKLVENPYLAVPNWKDRMRHIEGITNGLFQSIQDTTLFVSTAQDTVLSTKPRKDRIESK